MNRTIQVLLDTQNTPRINPDGSLTWLVSYDKTRDVGTVCLGTCIKNIIGVRLAPPRFEYTNEPYMTDPLTRFTVLINEFASQSFIATKRFHFMITGGEIRNLDSSSQYNYWEFCTHGFNRGYYWFNQPINELSQLTLSFGNPQEFRIRTPQLQGVCVQSSNPLTIVCNATPNAQNYYMTPLFAIGEQVVVSGFTTGDAVADALLILSINSTLTVSGISATSVQFAIDTSTMTTLNRDIVCNIQTNRYRSIFPLEIMYTATHDM
jgi:hypothetical protein